MGTPAKPAGLNLSQDGSSAAGKHDASLLPVGRYWVAFGSAGVLGLLVHGVVITMLIDG